jgi:hypothetical protein
MPLGVAAMLITVLSAIADEQRVYRVDAYGMLIGRVHVEFS